MIRSIRLQNWKTHADSEFEFGPGTNVIVGSIGSGKSSVMDAICYCLYGTTPGINGKRISTEDVITRKPNAADTAQLNLVFSYREKEYRVQRILKRNGTNQATLYCENKLLAGPKTSDVNAAIERELEMGFELFSRAVYSEQNQIDFFLKLSPGQRKEQFDQLLGLNKYESVRGNAVTLANRLKASVREKKSWLERVRMTIREEELRGLEQAVAEKRNANQALARELQENRQSLLEITRQFSELGEKEKEFREAQHEEMQTGAEITAREQEIARAKTVIGEHAPQETMERLQEKKGEQEKLLGAREDAERDTTTTQNTFNALVQQEMLLSAHIRELREHEQELRGLTGACPVCRRELEEHAKQELLEKNVQEQQGHEKQLKALAEKKQETRSKITLLREQENAAKKHAQSVIEEILRLEHSVTEHKNIAEKERQLAGLREKYARAQERRTKSGFDPESLARVHEALLRSESHGMVIEKEISGNENLIREMERQLHAQREQQKKIAEIEAEALQLERAAAAMSLFVNAVVATQAELREMLVETINEAMQDIWPRLYPYQDYVNAKMVIASGSYELNALQRNNEWVKVEGMLSGGERAAAALCMRIAFSLVLTQNLSWIILDEPTHNLDGKAVRELSEMLCHYLPELVEQIFVITHDKQMEQAASASIFLLHRDKDNDGFSQPETVNATLQNEARAE